MVTEREVNRTWSELKWSELKVKWTESQGNWRELKVKWSESEVKWTWSELRAKEGAKWSELIMACYWDDYGMFLGCLWHASADYGMFFGWLLHMPSIAEPINQGPRTGQYWIWNRRERGVLVIIQRHNNIYPPSRTLRYNPRQINIRRRSRIMWDKMRGMQELCA